MPGLRVEPVDYDPFADDPLLPPPVDPRGTRGTAAGEALGRLLTTPRKAVEQGITTEEAVPWAADLAMTLGGGGSVRAGLGGAKGQVGAIGGKPGIRAYHGSPHDFERFDASRIGTGEGAQAYGHGLYFAEQEAVARSYRDLADATVGGRPFNIDSPLHKAAGMVDEFGSPQAALAQAVIRRKEYDPFDFYGDVVRHLQRGNLPEFKSKGKMYEVDIRAKPEQMLDWDKRMHEQPLAAQELHRKITPDYPLAGETSESFYRNLKFGAPGRGFKGLGPEGASEALRKAGVPGLRYLDQGSRAAGEGTSNYVMFPGTEHLIDILKKYGLAGAAPLAGLQVEPVDYDPFK